MAIPFSGPAQNKDAAPKKLRNGDFKCFRCRQVFPGKEGNWFAWRSMEVHLCKACEKATENSPERRKG